LRDHLCSFRYISISGFCVGAILTSFFDVFAQHCAGNRVRIPLRRFVG